MDTVIGSHQLFWSNSGYMILFFISVLYVLWNRKKREKAFYSMGLYSIVLLGIVVYNPIFVKVMGTLFSEETSLYATYVRMFFLLPLTAIVAYTAVEMTAQVSVGWKRRATVVIVIIMIIMTGSTYNENGYYVKAENRYKIYPGTLEICDSILSDMDEDARVLIDTDGQSIYDRWNSRDNGVIEGMRQYTSEIKLMGTFDVRTIYGEQGQQGGCEYLSALEAVDYQYVIYRNDAEVSNVLRAYGFVWLKDAGGYTVMRKPDQIIWNIIGNVSEKWVSIDGLQQEYRILVVNDVHIIASVEDGVTEENIQTATSRHDTMFLGMNGKSSAENWNQMAEEINQYDADLVVFAGDMIDFVSESNIACLKEGMERIQSPILYIRSDHDYGIWYSGEAMTMKDAKAIHSKVDNNPEVWCSDLGEFLVVGWDGSTWKMKESALEEMKRLFAKGKPIILATHVPFDSLLEQGLQEESKLRRENRSLLWGADDYYMPDANTQAFLEMVYSPDTPVRAVVSAHLHFPYEINLTEQVPEYVFAPSFEGNIGMIHVVPGEE